MVSSFLCKAIGLKNKSGFKCALSITDLLASTERSSIDIPKTVSLPSSNYVSFQVLALNTLLEMTRRFSEENIFDNSLFSRIVRNMVVSSNFSAELAVTFLQEYVNKYGECTYHIDIFHQHKG